MDRCTSGPEDPSEQNKRGTNRTGGANIRSRPEQKGPNSADKEGQNQTEKEAKIRPKSDEVIRGVRPRNKWRRRKKEGYV